MMTMMMMMMMMMMMIDDDDDDDDDDNNDADDDDTCKQHFFPMAKSSNCIRASNLYLSWSCVRSFSASASCSSPDIVLSCSCSVSSKKNGTLGCSLALNQRKS